MTTKPTGPTGTLARMLAAALSDHEKDKAIIEMQAREITVLKNRLANPQPCACWWCRLTRRVTDARSV